jgi:hypothetical protein
MGVGSFDMGVNKTEISVRTNNKERRAETT